MSSSSHKRVFPQSAAEICQQWTSKVGRKINSGRKRLPRSFGRGFGVDRSVVDMRDLVLAVLVGYELCAACFDGPVQVVG